MKRNTRVAILAGAALISVAALRGPTEVVRAELGIPSPNALVYKGSLRGSGGLISGDSNIEIAFFDSPSMGQEYCRTIADSTQVVDGRFSVAIDDSCTAVIDDNEEVWILVTADVLDGNGPQSFPLERLHASAYSVRARNAHNGVVLGGVLWWARNSVETPIPDGYQICDGSEIVVGPLQGGVTPNLIGAFVRGATVSSNVAIAGQPTVTNEGGEHDHLVFRYSNTRWSSAQGNTLMDWGNGIGGEGSGEYPFSRSNTSSIVVETRDEGAHAHSTAVPVPQHLELVPLLRIF